MSLKTAVIGTVTCRLLCFLSIFAVMTMIMAVEPLVDALGAIALLLFATFIGLAGFFYMLEETIRTAYKRGRRRRHEMDIH